MTRAEALLDGTDSAGLRRRHSCSSCVASVRLASTCVHRGARRGGMHGGLRRGRALAGVDAWPQGAGGSIVSGNRSNVVIVGMAAVTMFEDGHLLCWGRDVVRTWTAMVDSTVSLGLPCTDAAPCSQLVTGGGLEGVYTGWNGRGLGQVMAGNIGNVGMIGHHASFRRATNSAPRAAKQALCTAGARDRRADAM